MITLENLSLLNALVHISLILHLNIGRVNLSEALLRHIHLHLIFQCQLFFSIIFLFTIFHVLIQFKYSNQLLYLYNLVSNNQVFEIAIESINKP